MNWDNILKEVQDDKHPKYYTLGNWGIVGPGNLPKELILRLTAATASYDLGVKSMDRVLQRYGSAWKERLE